MRDWFKTVTAEDVELAFDGICSYEERLVVAALVSTISEVAVPTSEEQGVMVYAHALALAQVMVGNFNGIPGIPGRNAVTNAKLLLDKIRREKVN